MPAERKVGMDHSLYRWSALPFRPVLQWPSGSTLALAVILSAEYFEPTPPRDAFQAASLAGGLGPRPYPDYARLSHREYGNRVGIFRVLAALDQYGIRTTLALDAETAERYPFLVDYCLQKGAEIVGHGIAITECITSRMGEDEEEVYIASALDRIERATGVRPVGWLGPEYSESSRTLHLLAKHGVRYVCDWVNDEQPYSFTIPEGPLYALPLMLEYDDCYALVTRDMTIASYEKTLREGFTCLLRDGATSGRVLAFNLHPWLIGQPFRIGALERVLEYMMGQGGVWAATGREIVDYFAQTRCGAEDQA